MMPPRCKQSHCNGYVGCFALWFPGSMLPVTEILACMQHINSLVLLFLDGTAIHWSFISFI